MLRDALGLIMDRPAFAAGRRAGQNNEAKSENPYSEGTGLWNDWNFGWHLGANMSAANQSRAIKDRTNAKSPWDLGASAAEQGLSARANPFHFGHASYDAWRLGWAQRKAS
ncbi:MAG: hypothetical protein AAFN59_12820 [Pseudomonadota bacterium]